MQRYRTNNLYEIQHPYVYLTGTHYFGFFLVFRHMFFDIRTPFHKSLSVFYSYIKGVSSFFIPWVIIFRPMGGNFVYVNLFSSEYCLQPNNDRSDINNLIWW